MSDNDDVLGEEKQRLQKQVDDDDVTETVVLTVEEQVDDDDVKKQLPRENNTKWTCMRKAILICFVVLLILIGVIGAVLWTMHTNRSVDGEDPTEAKLTVLCNDQSSNKGCFNCSRDSKECQEDTLADCPPDHVLSGGICFPMVPANHSTEMGTLIKSGDTGIGQGFYLPDTSLVEDNGSGKSIFKEIPLECISTTSSHLINEEHTFFKNTESFYNEIGVKSSLSGEIRIKGFTLGASLDAASKSIDSTTLEVMGMSMEFSATTGFSQIEPDCIMKSMELDEDFVKDFERLDNKITEPQLPSSWSDYDTVLKTYGSHIIKRISHGSKLTQYVFSKSNEGMSSNDFQIKACMEVKEIKLKSCSQFTKADYEKVTHFATSDKLTIRGGSADTRAELRYNRTPELWKQFLLEANLTKQAISTQYISIWDILQSRYLGTEHFIKAANMESYYLGFLNTGCYPKVDGSTVLRRFILVDDNPDKPGYQCQLAPLGCMVNDDCHTGGAGSVCYCYGSSCVESDKKFVVDPRHTLSEGRYMRTDQDDLSYNEGAVNPSCKFHFPGCNCVKPGGSGSWKTLWPSTHRKRSLSIRRNAHKKLMAQEKLIAQEKFMAVELVE